MVRRDVAKADLLSCQALTYPLIQEPNMSSPPDFSKEDLKGSPAEFAPGAWVLGNAHFAGGAILQSFDHSTFDQLLLMKSFVF